MKKKLLIVSLLIAVVLVLSFIRIHKINKNVPKDFAIKTFQKNETASMNAIDVSVVKYSLGKAYHYDGGNPNDQYTNLPILVEVKVKNTSTEVQDISMLKESSLFGGYDYSQTGDVNITKKQLNPGEEAVLDYNYTVDKKTFKLDSMKFVIGTVSLKKYDYKNYIKNYREGVYEGIVFSL